jgi:hypothetical protein
MIPYTDTHYQISIHTILLPILIHLFGILIAVPMIVVIHMMVQQIETY